MRKLIIGLALAAGCRSGGAVAGSPGSSGGSNMTGAASPQAAIEQFMGAVKAQDLQALGAIWGTKNGPARDQMANDQLQERELIMLCYLKHDSFTVLGDAPTTDGNRTFAVEVKSGTITHTGQFAVTRAGTGRYYVLAVNNIQEFQDVCGKH
ncbi:MAG TPA: hypothetical protein VMV51_07860 [Gemmatimonadaceae bacterium]|nr:hypothetical protein [Gemmatimonadaceae bacterium]